MLQGLPRVWCLGPVRSLGGPLVCPQVLRVLFASLVFRAVGSFPMSAFYPYVDRGANLCHGGEQSGAPPPTIYSTSKV